jgi:hypothetical protein
MEVTSHFQWKYSFDVYLVIVVIIVGDLHQIKPDVEFSALLFTRLEDQITSRYLG